MHDVFISYSHVNKDVADAICHHLENEGVRCWYAPRDVGPGDPWTSAIVRAIRGAKIFVLIFSKDSNNSDQVLREISLAAESDCLIIPFRIDASKMCDSLEYYLHAVHWFDAVTPPLLANIERLCEMVKRVLGHNPPPPPPPPPPKKKKSKLLWLILPAVLAMLALYVGLFSLISSFLTPFFTEDPVRNIEFTYMSELGKYRYPFYGHDAISYDGNTYFVENIEDGTLAHVKMDGGFFLAKGIEPPFTRLEDGSIDYTQIWKMAPKTSELAYFYERNADLIHIYNSATTTWVNTDILLDLLPSEYCTCTITSSGISSNTSLGKDGISLLVTDVDRFLFSKVIHIAPKGPHITTVDISEYQLTNLVFTFTIDSPYADWVVMADTDFRFYLLNLLTGEVHFVENETLYTDYLPYLGESEIAFSNNKKYMAFVESSSRGHTILRDTETGKLLWSNDFIGAVTVDFLPNDTFFCFDSTTSSLKLYDPEEGKQSTLFDKSFFEENKHFKDAPDRLFYDSNLELFFFVSSGENSAGDYTLFLVVTDVQGNVIAKSEFSDIPYDSYYVDVWVTENTIYFIIQSGDDDPERENIISTQLYCTMYEYDRDGNIRFYPNTDSAIS